MKKRFPDAFNLYLISDTHEGSSLQHKTGLKKTIQTIADDPMGFWCHGGDALEGIMVDDKRYDADTEDDSKGVPLVQAKRVIKTFEPIKDKCLFILIGNHEYKLSKWGNLTRFICGELGIPYGTYACVYTFRDKKGKPMFKSYHNHGWGQVNSVADDPLRRLANLKLSMKRKLQGQFGDTVLNVMSHTHKLLVAEPEEELYLTTQGKDIRAKYTRSPQFGDYIDPNLKWYVNTGSFYRLYNQLGISGYAERMMLQPSELGYVKVEVRDGRIDTVRKVVL